MSGFSNSVQMLIQGFYSLLWIAIAMDVGSPSLDLRRFPDLSAQQTFLILLVVFPLAFVIGVMMHTFSRHLFRKAKDDWARIVLMSARTRQRYTELGLEAAVRKVGGWWYTDLDAAEDEVDRNRKAGEMMHGIDYAVATKAPHVYRQIQVYRQQYRLGRGFIIPSAVLSLILPFWEPVASVPSGVNVGPMNLVSVQLFLLTALLASFAFVSFRERAFRYEAARTKAYLVMAALKED